MGDGVRRVLSVCCVLACAALSLCVWGSGRARGRAQSESSLSKWRPTRDYSGLRYVGAETCAGCHTQEAATQPSTPMGRASERAADCEVLKANPRMTFRDGPYTHTVKREGAGAVYAVTDGERVISEPILYCFGQGAAGQTYVFQHGGLFYESRVSYFRSLGGLAITIEHPRAVPASLEEALGRPMTQEAARGCFGCHTTAVAGGTRLQLERVAAGVSCEACHGPGERHVAAVKARDFRNLHIFNPAGLDAMELSQEFCGSCHESFDAVMSLPEQGGARNIRFQPYRIFNSRGHLTGDPRMSCVACHDPHRRLERDPAYYDARCLACHLAAPREPKTTARSAPACPVSTKGCASCHMPKVELPEMHTQFTDHWVRIPRPGEPVPR